jgi:hypothetical protein
MSSKSSKYLNTSSKGGVTAQLTLKKFFSFPLFKLFSRRPYVVQLTLAWIYFDCPLKAMKDFKMFKIDSAESSLIQQINVTEFRLSSVKNDIQFNGNYDLAAQQCQQHC